MHIADGLLPAPICLGGYALTGLTVWRSLRQIRRDRNPAQGMARAALLTAAFFVASGIHIPIPPASVHLILNGLVGIVLGPYAFLAVLVGLMFQAVMFGHGGLTTLGVNALIMGWPAIAASLLFHGRNRWLGWLPWRSRVWVASFSAGAGGVLLAAIAFLGITLSLLPVSLNGSLEQTAIWGLTLAHVPLAIIEGLFAVAVVLFLRRVQPDLLYTAPEHLAAGKMAPETLAQEEPARVL